MPHDIFCTFSRFHTSRDHFSLSASYLSSWYSKYSMLFLFLPVRILNIPIDSSLKIIWIFYNFLFFICHYLFFNIIFFFLVDIWKVCCYNKHINKKDERNKSRKDWDHRKPKEILHNSKERTVRTTKTWKRSLKWTKNKIRKV